MKNRVSARSAQRPYNRHWGEVLKTAVIDLKGLATRWEKKSKAEKISNKTNGRVGGSLRITKRVPVGSLRTWRVNFSEGRYFNQGLLCPSVWALARICRVNARIALVEDVNGLEGHSPKPVCGTAAASFPHASGSSSIGAAATTENLSPLYTVPLFFPSYYIICTYT